MIKTFQYQFTLEILKIQIELPFSCLVEVWWRRSNKKITTKKKVEITGRQKILEIGEKLTMTASCQNEQGIFTAKPSIINIVIVSPGYPNKSGGYYNLQLTEVLKGYDPKNPTSKNYDVPIQNCPTKSGMLKFILQARCLQQVSNTNQRFPLKQVHFFNCATFPIQRQSIEGPIKLEDKYEVSSTTSNKFQKDLQFSFQQSREFTRQNIQSFRPSRIPSTPLLELKHPEANQTFYQLLQVKRKLDDRNLEFAKLQSDYILQGQKLKQVQAELKNKDLKLINEINLLTIERDMIKKQLAEQNLKSKEEACKYNKLKEENAELQRQNKNSESLQKQVERKQEELNYLQGIMNARLKDAVIVNEKLTVTVTSLNSQSNGYYERIKDLEKQKNNLESIVLKEKQKNQEKIKVFKASSQQKDNAIEQIKKDFEKFALERNKLIIQNKDLQSKLSEERQKKSYLIQENNSLTQRIHTIQQELDEKNRQIEVRYKSLLQQHQYVVSEMISKIKLLEEVIDSKDNMLQKAKQYVQMKEQQIKNRDAFINRAKQYVQNKEIELREVIKLNEQNLTRMKDLESKLEEKDKQLNLALSKSDIMYQGEIKKLTADVTSLRNQLQSKQRFLGEYLSDLANCQQQIAELEEQLHLKNQQIEELKMEREEIQADEQSQCSQIKQSMDTIMKQKIQYQIQLQIYGKQIKCLKEKLQESSKRANLNNSYQNKENLIHRARAGSLEINLQKTKQRMKKMEERMLKLQAENIQLNVELVKAKR